MGLTIPLKLLPAGHLAEVAELSGRTDQVKRLRDLGFVHGAQVEMVQAGVPCIVRLGERKLGYRETEMASVFVRPRGVH